MTRFHFPVPDHLDLAALPKVDFAEIRELWTDDFYDGPLQAVVEWQERRLLLLSLDDPAVWPRRVGLFVLSADSMARLEAEHLDDLAPATVDDETEPEIVTLELGPAVCWSEFQRPHPDDPHGSKLTRAGQTS